jgi:hypothetical protein
MFSSWPAKTPVASRKATPRFQAPPRLAEAQVTIFAPSFHSFSVPELAISLSVGGRPTGSKRVGWRTWR